MFSGCLAVTGVASNDRNILRVKTVKRSNYFPASDQYIHKAHNDVSSEKSALFFQIFK